jgi:Domain of unknown function (DUF4259)
MGMWGAGPFENDDAVDFLGDLRDGTPVEIAERLDEVFDLVLEIEQQVEMREMSVAIAAASLVAIWSGAPEPANRGITELLASIPFVADDEQRTRAAQVFARAIESEDNEWYDHWAEAGSIGDVRDALAPYREAVI